MVRILQSMSALVVFFLCSLSLASDVPKVTFSYAEVFDSLCVKKTGDKIDPKWVSELTSRLPDLRSQWRKSGRVLLKTTVGMIGTKFDEREIGAVLSLCSLFPSLHDPLLINMRYSLKSFTQTPLSTEVTLSIVYHEILHRYLKGKIPARSALLTKYGSEDETVLRHLHLFAVQKATYLALGLSKTLADITKKDESLPNPSYKRAWEIVNSLEDYHSFLKELTGS